MDQSSGAKQKRDLAPLLPALVGAVLLIWGLKVMYTSFAYGSLPIAGWHTEQKNLFGLSWVIVFMIVLLPAYLYAIGTGWQSLKRLGRTSEPPKRYWLAAVGISVLLGFLTFCARVAVTAWFPSPMHAPFESFNGGMAHGLAATMVLVLLEAGVLAGIKHQTRHGQHSYPLLIPACFALVLLVWGGTVVYSSFKAGSLPVVGWQTDHRLGFGWLWLLIFIAVLLPAYLYAVSLGLLGVIGQMDPLERESQNFWLVAISNTALLCLITFCARFTVTAWFAKPLHPPFDQFTGGVFPGLIASISLLLVTTFYYRIARSF